MKAIQIKFEETTESYNGTAFLNLKVNIGDLDEDYNDYVEVGGKMPREEFLKYKFLIAISNKAKSDAYDLKIKYE